jgi:AcrR family transcriptional regulator
MSFLKRKDQKELTKKKIFETSIFLFIEQGYENVTIDAIAKSIGLTKGAFYHHFASKDAILIEFSNIMIDDLVNGLLTSVKENKNSSSVMKIKALIRSIELFFEEKQSVIEILLSQSFHAKVPLEDVFINEVSIVFQNVLELGLGKREFQLFNNAETTARYICTLLYCEIKNFGKRTSNTKNISEVFGDIFQLLFHGIFVSI